MTNQPHQVILTIEFPYDQEEILDNEEKVLEVLTELGTIFDTNFEPDYKQYKKSKNSEELFRIDLENDFTEFSRIKPLIDVYLKDSKNEYLPEVYYNHDISMYTTEQLTAFIKSKQLGGDYLLTINLVEGSNNKDNLIKAVNKTLELVTNTFYKDNQPVAEEILDSFNAEDDIGEDDEGLFVTLSLDLGIQLQEYITNFGKYTEFLKQVGTINKTLSMDIEYSIYASNEKLDEGVYFD